MDIIDSSHHICLICNQTVVGLLRYVEHFKSHATPQESHLVEQKVDPFVISRIKNTNDSIQRKDGHDGSEIASLKHTSPNSSSQVNENALFSGDTSPLSEFNGDFHDADLSTDAFLSPKHCPDFFQSLELKSTNEELRPKQKIKAFQRLSILEDDLHAESLLPITSILSLSNLDFSSDDDDECMRDLRDDDDDGVASWSDEDNLAMSRNPPSGHTGGKWKPGEGPKRKMAIASKWKPGQRPAPASRKKIMKNSFKGRGPRADIGKTFHCNVCSTQFPNRTSYSLHFSEDLHKGLVAQRRQDKASAPFVEGRPIEDEESLLGQHWPSHNDVEKTYQSIKQLTSQSMSQPGGQAMETASVNCMYPPHNALQTPTILSSDLGKNQPMEPLTPRIMKKVAESFHCPVCDLYFSSKLVYNTHCETKVHKDGLVKQGFKECQDEDGNIIRVDVNSDAIYMDSSQRTRLAFDEASRNTSFYLKGDEKHECTICKKSFKRKYEMARHLITRMHKTRAQCQPEEQWVENLHKYNKYMMRLSPFQCGICRFYFNRQRDFINHMCCAEHVQNCAEMMGPMICVSCKFKTHKHSQMIEHLERSEHFAAVEKNHRMCIVRESHTQVTCKFCGVKMHSTVRMKRHHERRHADRLTEVQEAMKVKPIEYIMHHCPICRKSFRAKSMLQLHFLMAHKKQAVFDCKVCERGFLDQRRLDNHLRTRYHAKRVIALKVDKQSTGVGQGSQGSSVSEEKNNQNKCKVTRKGKREISLKEKDVERDGTKVKVKDTVTSLKDVTTEDASQNDELPTRRSSRKRKKVEFFDLIHDDTDTETENPKLKRNCNKTKGNFKIKIGLKSKTVTYNGQLDKNLSSETDFDNSKKRTASKKKFNINRRGHTSNKNIGSTVLREEIVEDFSKEGGVVKGGNVQAKKRASDLKEDVDDETLLEASRHVFSCIYCDFAAGDLIELRKHYNNSHPNDILTCQPCNQYFLSLKAYKIHCSGRGHQLKLREQSGETVMHKCPLCDKRFLQESCCSLHVETVHRHPSCEADLQRIHKGQDLVTQLYGDHVEQVENLSNDSSVSCPECGRFVRKDTLIEHLRLHTGERPYACRFCPKSFAGRLTLRRHISSHLNMPLFMCDTCGKEFKRNTHLVKHIQQHDLEKKGVRHTCRVCKVWFFTPEELARHMKRHGDRNFKCTWPGCQWTFVLSGELKSHMFTHTKEKKYLCDMCGFGAPTRTRLRRHSKIHDKSRGFKCDYCPYKATCKTHLKRHMRIHINSKPFACPYCNYTCNTHENIRKHILKTQKHKGMKLYPCKLCSDFGCDSSRDFKTHLMTVHADYLRENAIDSLAVFSGLYKRDEDLKAPKEGAEILQVTKGRFFRTYQNPDAPQIKRVKPKKVKKTPKLGEVKVLIVPPSELEAESVMHQHCENRQQEMSMRVNGPHVGQQLQQQQEPSPFQEPQKIIVDLQGQELQAHQVQTDQTQDTSQENHAQHYITVPNLFIQASYVPQNEQLSLNPINAVDQQVQDHPQDHESVSTPLTMSDSGKVYWTVEFPDPQLDVSNPTSAAAPEPWYSGMPQVHAPSTPELNPQMPGDESSGQTSFLPNTYFHCDLPTAQVYTTQNSVVVLEETGNAMNNNDNSGL